MKYFTKQQAIKLLYASLPDERDWTSTLQDMSRGKNAIEGYRLVPRTERESTRVYYSVDEVNAFIELVKLARVGKTAKRHIVTIRSKEGVCFGVIRDLTGKGARAKPKCTCHRPRRTAKAH